MSAAAEKRNCRNCETAFAIEPDDLAYYQRIDVPAPTFCPQCRMQRRFSFRNERTFYKRQCNLCKKDIVAMYPADAPLRVYCVKCWWSDKWDPLEYGRDFDFSKSFNEQFAALRHQVPEIAMMNDDGVASLNSEYSYDFFFSKNCYLMVCGWHVDNAAYSYHVDFGKDIFDCTHVDGSESMYECVGCYKSQNCRYCDLVFDSHNCTFGYDLRGCSDCVMCVGLRNKSHCILNKQYSKEEYDRRIAEMGLGNRTRLQELQKEFREFSLRFPRKYGHILKSVNSSGHWVLNAKNAKSCFYARNAEDSAFMLVNDVAQNSYDCNNTGKATLCYNSVTPDQSYACKMTLFCTECRNVEYSVHCQGAENCFGSSGLKKGSYVIFNKQYGKEEYEKLRAKIVAHMKETGEWGEFFRPETNLFAYNQTAAHEWFPMSRKEALAKDLGWKEEEDKGYQPTKQARELPENISETDDSITKEIVACPHEGKCNEKCTTAFRITDQELRFYRRLDIPLPQFCPNCRHYQRITRRNPPRLWPRSCQCAGKNSKNEAYANISENHRSHETAAPCPNQFETSYAPDRPEIVYCEQCYNAEIA